MFAETIPCNMKALPETRSCHPASRKTGHSRFYGRLHTLHREKFTEKRAVSFHSGERFRLSGAIGENGAVIPFEPVPEISPSGHRSSLNLLEVCGGSYRF